MLKLTPEGEKTLSALAQRYGLSFDSARAMLEAVARGGGAMAQFNVPELGGGQWMRGGMTMVGDMFNNSLKATVDNLCNDLANLLATEPFVPAAPMSSQMQSQGGFGGASYTSFTQSGSWWPSDLGNPSSTGSQNNLRYAYFPASNRLVLDDGGRVEVYDTTGYDIGGFGQQQGGGASLTFSSSRGTVRLDSLPRLTGQKPAAERSAPQEPVAQGAPPETRHGDTASILGLIEQLSQLKEKGILTDEEFAAKKSELLKRL